VQAATGSVSPGRWIAARLAHPVLDLNRSTAFYRDRLGLPVRGGFTGHDGYSGMFFAVPGGAELELTTGPARPRPGTDDDLLVLYLATPEEARGRVADLQSAGVPTVASANPYWDRWGRTFLDPDGYAVVVAAVDDAGAPTTRAPSTTSASSPTPASASGYARCSSSPRTSPPDWTPTCTRDGCSSP
jgi:catechol 2,3-dioxygenase-like lactoylglutathione lyase family enzyme